MPATESGRERIARTLEGIRKAGLAARKRFDEMGDKIWKYAYDPTYQFLYQDWETRNGELFHKAKISKAAQFMEVMGPYLYQYNPNYEVRPEREAQAADVARFKVEERYLDWSARRGDLYTHARRAVDEATCRGRGVVWTGYNPRRRCVQHVYDSAKGLIDDPDAKTIEERNIVFRERVKPRWELANLYPKARAQIVNLPRAGDMPSRKSGQSSGGKWSEPVAYYEAYALTGLGRYADGVGDVGEDGMVDDSPYKYVYSGEQLLDCLPWELPLFKADLWPCSTLDLRRLPNSIYPAAPLETSLGLIEALNWSHTLILSQLQVSTRLAFAVMNTSGEKMKVENILKLVSGEHYDIAVFEQVGNEFPEIGKMIQQIQIKNSVPELERLNTMLSYEIERASGMYDILFAGQTQTQLRTAEDAKLKDRNSRTRIDDMRSQVEKFATELGQKARIGARFLESSEDIGQLFGPMAGQAWGDLAPAEEVRMNREKRDQIIAMVSQQAQAQGADYQLAMAFAEKKANEFAPDVLVDFDQWLLDADVTIESGSMRRKDIDQEIDVYSEAMNQTVATLLQSPDPRVQAIGLRITGRGFEVKGAPADLVNDIDEAAELVAQGPPALPAPAGPPAEAEAG